MLKRMLVIAVLPFCLYATTGRAADPANEIIVYQVQDGKITNIV